MNISFKCKLHEENYFRSRLGFIVRDFISEINTPPITELQVVTDNTINNANGETKYNISTDKIEYTILIKKSLVNKENIKNNHSELYITLYHELFHVKDMDVLSQNIDMLNVPRNIGLFQNQDHMALGMGCVLWGEYYAYIQQFQKYGGVLRERQLSSTFETIASALIAYKDFIHTEQHKATQLLNRAIFEGLYDICAILAYKATVPSYDYKTIFADTGNFLRVNLMGYVDAIYDILLECLEAYPTNFTPEYITTIGRGFMLFYNLLHITISFNEGLILSYDASQPFLKWQEQYSKLKTSNP